MPNGWSGVPLVLRVAFWRIRPLLVAGALLIACAVVARQAAPPPPPTDPVVVAGTDLAAGDTLAAGDLRVVAVPRALVPDGASSRIDDVTGRTITTAVPRGLAIVASFLDTGRFGLAQPDGTVAVPVRLADPAVASLLRPGDRVDLVAPGDAWWGGAGQDDDAGPVVLARDALVLDLVAGAAPGALGLGGGATETLTVVAVPPDAGHRLAGSGAGSVGAVLVGGS